MSEPKKKWILLIEDEEDIRKIVKEQILTLGAEYGVIESKDGSEARGRIDNQAYNCIVTDLNMPKQDGQSVIKYARGSELNATTPVIVVTGYPDSKLASEYEYLLQIEKPFKTKDLLKTIVEQIRLGATDQRIPIQLFNLFMSSLVEWAEKENLAPEPQAPKPMTGQQDLEGDFYLFCRFQFYESKPWMGLGMDKEFLAKLPGADDFKGKLGRLSDALWAVLKRQSLNLFNTETLSMSERLYCGKAGLPELGAAGFRGITIPVKTSNGVLYAKAMVSKTHLKKG